ncbi:hypothetical protein [Methanosarcina horonobensis]|uniref:hypothetical protein n=1 Tax=Methanosarcina horonobensis TaxID=418008 RepID=UPI000B05C2DF|nr:hypothetical protein [Methanosarcina horonobensis]
MTELRKGKAKKAEDRTAPKHICPKRREYLKEKLLKDLVELTEASEVNKDD